jgi:hypothetical protein
MSVTVVLRPFAAPGNIDKYPNVTAAGAQSTDTGTHSTDLTNFLTAVGTAASSTGNLMKITYTDDAGSVQNRVINTTQIQSVI